MCSSTNGDKNLGTEVTVNQHEGGVTEYVNPEDLVSIVAIKVLKQVLAGVNMCY